MKCIEVTGWGNKHKHLIPLNKIVEFHFETSYTTISFVNGKQLNIIEDELVIKEMLGYYGMGLVSEEDLRTLDELPF